MKRMFLIGLAVPFATAGLVALAIWPDSLFDWLTVAAAVPAAAAGVALVYMWQSRSAPLEVRHPTTRERLRKSGR